MTASVTWSINDMKRNTADGGVFEVRWSAKAADDTETDCVAVEAGKYICTPDASASDFVAYDDLTEAVVLGWVQEHLNAGNDTVSDIETRLNGKVDAQVAKKTSEANGMPWVVVAAE
jgi:hypothetical protein